jgi:hypothetical protein
MWRWCINIIIVFLDISYRIVCLKQRFGDWILSPSSSENMASWAQSIELDSNSETLKLPTS